ncbi:MAG: heavy metal translocating P-type ATPase [Bacteroidales bacterium]|nr:heavy metal translocating P-type ATPase [Bacteroidales bacterium]
MTKCNYPVEGLGCASCVARVEKALQSVEGVGEVSVSLASNMAQVSFDEERVTPSQLREAVRAAGYDLLVPKDDPQASNQDASPSCHPEQGEGSGSNADAQDGGKLEDEAEQRAQRKLQRMKESCLFCVVLAVFMMLVEMDLTAVRFKEEVLFLLSSVFVFGFGWKFFRSAWTLLRHGSANMDTLVALSIGISYLFSVFNWLFPQVWTSRGLPADLYFSSCGMIVTFVSLGRYLEERAKRSTTASLRALKALQPAHSYAVGETVPLQAGERIPVDGIVTDGAGTADESMLSGESEPVAKSVGAQVFAGTMLLSGGLEVRAEKVGAGTMLSGMIDLVRDAQGSKARIQRTVDKVAAVFVPVILGIAVLTLLVWSLAVPSGFAKGLLAAVTVLVIACPCSLGLATPTALIAGIGNAAGKGILVKDADALQVAGSIDTVVLDKTGTVTEGVVGADVIREGSAAAVAALKERGLEVWMLSGDKRDRAEAIARQAGIERVESEVCPEYKAAFVKGLQEQGRKVAMAGDGINDSAALAYADLSMAMGTGTDVAMDSAMATIVSGDLRKLPQLLDLSRKTSRIIRENLFWAFIYNILAVPVAALGLINPMIGAACMALSSVCVVLNSLRLRK